MIHKMNLHNNPFESIKNGSKTIEMRLNDEKRKLIKVNDQIEFTNNITNEIMTVKVKGIYRFSNFKELYSSFNKVNLGYKEEELADPSDMLKYYSNDKIDQYGVLALEIEII